LVFTTANPMRSYQDSSRRLAAHRISFRTPHASYNRIHRTDQPSGEGRVAYPVKLVLNLFGIVLKPVRLTVDFLNFRENLSQKMFDFFHVAFLRQKHRDRSGQRTCPKGFFPDSNQCARGLAFQIGKFAHESLNFLPDLSLR
jgi:hypothetical protein